MQLRALQFAVLILGILLALPTGLESQIGTNSLVNIRLLVEPENVKSGVPGRGGEDLTPAEIKQLRSLLSTEIGKLANHRLVDNDDRAGRLGLAVTAAKIRAGQQTWFVLSSALTLTSVDGKTNDLITHDVIVETSLAQAARVIVLYLKSSELRGILGLLK